MSLRRLVALLLAAALGTSLVACSGDDDDPVRQVEVDPTPIEAFAADTVRVARASFCEQVADEAVVAAVGEVRATRHYGNGERARFPGGVVDVSHEWACVFVGRGGDVARAWVFVPPVTPGQARGLVADVRRTRGCRVVDAHDFGTPSAGAVCVRDGRAEASYRGLFGDAWLACSLTDGGRREPATAALVKRAGEWCVQAATAASD